MHVGSVGHSGVDTAQEVAYGRVHPWTFVVIRSVGLHASQRVPKGEGVGLCEMILALHMS